MKNYRKFIVALTATSALTLSASAKELKVNFLLDAREEFKEIVKPWEEKTGYTITFVDGAQSVPDRFAQFRLWLSNKASNVDVLSLDVIWPPQLAKHLVDLTEYGKDVIPLHIKSVIDSQTVNGKVVALPMFTDAPGLFYRKDLLEKYGKSVPKTWDELAETAKYIQDKERAAGNKKMWGFTFQGRVAGLPYNGLEWIHSHGGGSIVEEDGTISINNPKAAKALAVAKSWVGTIAPKGVLSYGEEESRAVWQNGNAVFHRQWPYAYYLGSQDKSPIKGKFAVAELPGEKPGGGAHALGGWSWGINKYSKHVEAAKSFVLFMAQPENQKGIVLARGLLPTAKSLYDDPEVIAKVPWVVDWKPIFEKAIPRPSIPTKSKYGEVANKSGTAFHNALSGKGSIESNLEKLEIQLMKMKGSGWK